METTLFRIVQESLTSIYIRQPDRASRCRNVDGSVLEIRMRAGFSTADGNGALVAAGLGVGIRSMQEQDASGRRPTGNPAALARELQCGSTAHAGSDQ